MTRRRLSCIYFNHDNHTLMSYLLPTDTPYIDRYISMKSYGC